ncbi:sarcosine oxidase subunit gamma family protein [Sphaerisporangium sp. NPDC088356]|uniref:sarcosine oxidase subunit gamma n=1 Tax=Sphaerisporangium sp. NPDC088356 TaxID=3154871 RepID=UPI0034365A97
MADPATPDAATPDRVNPRAGHREMVERVSPLAGFQGVSDARVRVREIPFLRQTNVRVDPARVPPSFGLRLPVEPGTWLRSGETDVLWLGPDEWLAIGDLDLPRSEDVAVTDVSAQRTTLLVAGPGARDLLAHGCSLDLHPSVFRPGSCAQTMLARAQVVLVAREDDEFWVLVRASFARYLADWIIDAAVDY